MTPHLWEGKYLNDSGFILRNSGGPKKVVQYFSNGKRPTHNPES